jgi:hypothetical protein
VLKWHNYQSLQYFEDTPAKDGPIAETTPNGVKYWIKKAPLKQQGFYYFVRVS